MAPRAMRARGGLAAAMVDDVELRLVWGQTLDLGSGPVEGQ